MHHRAKEITIADHVFLSSLVVMKVLDVFVPVK